jgi:hypothetical protein
MDEQKATQEIVDLADKAVRGRDTEALATLRTKNYDVYQKLLALQTTPVDQGRRWTTTGSSRSQTTQSPRFGPKRPSRPTSSGQHRPARPTPQAMEHYTVTGAGQAHTVDMPAIKPSLDKLKQTIPGADNKKIFDAQLAVSRSTT